MIFSILQMVASKFLNDEGEDDEVFNTEWAQSADLTILQINRLEKDFLKAIVSKLILIYIILYIYFINFMINYNFKIYDLFINFIIIY